VLAFPRCRHRPSNRARLGTDENEHLALLNWNAAKQGPEVLQIQSVLLSGQRCELRRIDSAIVFDSRLRYSL
jgi:hypothetical protein